MGFVVLFLLLLVSTGWWLYSKWSSLREAQAARREAEMLLVFEARTHAREKPAPVTPPASDFYPTLPEGGLLAGRSAARGSPLSS